MKTTWKPTAGGILAIVGGAINLFAGLGLTLFAFAPFQTNPLAVGVLGTLFLGTVIVALIGGINALQRKRWGLSLAGAICAILSPAAILGIISTVFIAMARDEFPQDLAKRETFTPAQISAREAAEVTQSTDPECRPDFSEPSEGERNA